MLVSDAWFERMSTIETYRQDTSAMGRIDSWNYAIDLANRRPIVGGGFSAFTLNYVSNSAGWRDSHSIYFEVTRPFEITASRCGRRRIASIGSAASSTTRLASAPGRSP